MRIIYKIIILIVCSLLFTGFLSNYFETTDFTVTIHDGPLAGQEIPHVHVHVIPRKQGDGGRALPAMFPNAAPPNPPDFASLANLCNAIKEAAE